MDFKFRVPANTSTEDILKGFEKLQGFIPDAEIQMPEKNGYGVISVPQKISYQVWEDLCYSEHMEIWNDLAFPMNQITKFREPRKGKSGVNLFTQNQFGEKD